MLLNDTLKKIENIRIKKTINKFFLAVKSYMRLEASLLSNFKNLF